MNCVAKRIEEIGILPVLSVKQKESAVPLAKALQRGGIPMLEVVLRTKAALEVISAIKEACPDILVGAGTILELKQAQAALERGADYLVSPDFNLELIDFCGRRNVLMIPGCTTPSELGTAQRLGLQLVKFFPSEPSGGIEAIKLLSGPFPNLRFIPTGGITQGNLARYLREPKVAACGGSFMAPADLIREERWEEITENCRQAVCSSLGFSLKQIQFTLDRQKTGQIETLPENLAQSIQKAGVAFSATEIEKSCGNVPGTWEMVFSTNSILRSLVYLKEQGVDCYRENESTEEDCVSFEAPAVGGRIRIRRFPS